MVYKAFTVRANIHTMEILTDNSINASKLLREYKQNGTDEQADTARRIDSCIEMASFRGRSNAEKNGRNFILNLNKWYGEKENIWFYSEFVEILETVATYLNIKGRYVIKRVDVKFDSSDSDFYEENKKLVRFWMTAIADGMKEKNMWQAWDSKRLRQRSLKLWGKDRSYEIEYYNKEMESNGTDQSKGRLEFHFTGKMTIEKMTQAIDARLANLQCKTGVPLDTDEWTTSLEPTKDSINATLMELWKNAQCDNLHRFIERDAVQEVLFTRQQLVKLLCQIAEESNGTISMSDPEKWIDKHNKTYGRIQFVRDRDIDDLWNCITDAKDIFFSGT